MRSASKTRSLFVGLLVVLSLMPASISAGASSSRLNPISITFPTSESGYVFSLYNCEAKTCAALRRTENAGSSWIVVPIPRQLEHGLHLVSWGTYDLAQPTLAVHFADAKDGWIYGAVPAPNPATTANPNWVSRLWSTHNGGETWTQVRLDPLSLTGGVVTMASHGPWTYLFGISFQSDRAYILGTRSATDQWARKSTAPMELPAGGTQLQGAFTFAGSSGWFVAGNDRGFTASARLSSNGNWRAWSGPSFEKIGASFTPIVAVTSRVLVGEGASAGFVYPPTSTVPAGWNKGASWLFVSYDAGAIFKPLTQLSSSYRGGYSTVPGLPASPEPGMIFLQRATNSSYQLVESLNWGRTWRVVLDYFILQVAFPSRSTGFAIVQERTGPATFSLFRSTDAGSKWNRVSL